MEDKRKYNKGTKGNKGGRPKGSALMKAIDLSCEKFIKELLSNEMIKNKAIKEQIKKENIKDFLYLIKVGKDYKIGITSNISNRFKQYSSHSGYNAEIIYLIKISNPNELEKLLVHRYSHLCTRGDWFTFKQEDVLDLITYSSKFIYNERR